MSGLKQTSMSQVREKSYLVTNYTQLERSLAKIRSTTKSVVDDYSDRSHSKSPNEISKKQKGSIVSLKTQLHNIKSEVSRIMGRKSPQKKSKTKAYQLAKQKQFNDKSSFFKSDVQSVDLDDRPFENLKASQFQSRDQQFNYFKIEYQILVQEYNNLKKRYVLQKSQHKDRIGSFNKKIRFLQKILKQKQTYIFQYKTEIQIQLQNIRQQLISKTSNTSVNSNYQTLSSLSGSQHITVDQIKLVEEQTEKIKELVEQIDHKDQIIQTLNLRYNQIKIVAEDNIKINHDLKITNGSLNKRLEEVELTRHQYQEVRCYQQNLRKEDIFRMEQLQGQIRIREQVNENLRGKIDSLGFQLSLLSNQNRELMMKNPEEEVARKTEQLQLQLDSMMMVVNKLEQSKNRLEDQKSMFIKSIQNLQDQLKQTKSKQEVKETKQSIIQSTQLVSSQTQTDNLIENKSNVSIQNVVNLQSQITKPLFMQPQIVSTQIISQQTSLYRCYINKCAEISKHIHSIQVLREQNQLFIDQITILKQKVQHLNLQNQKLTNDFSSKLIELISQNPNDSSRSLTTQLCNKIKNMSQLLTQAAKQSEAIMFNESQKRQNMMRQKNKQIMLLQNKIQQFKDIVKNQFKQIGTYKQTIKTLQQVNNQNEQAIISFIKTKPNLEKQEEIQHFIGKIKALSSSEVFQMNSHIEIISKLTKENELLYSDVLALSEQLSHYKKD